MDVLTKYKQEKFNLYVINKTSLTIKISPTSESKQHMKTNFLVSRGILYNIIDQSRRQAGYFVHNNRLI
jgi:hypothetical protein